MRNRGGNIRVRLSLAAVLLIALAPLGANGGISSQTTPFVPHGFSGTGLATMQAVTAPARPARVAYVPGSPIGEAWAIALSSAVIPKWDSASTSGQVLFMRYTLGTGWQIEGPP